MTWNISEVEQISLDKTCDIIHMQNTNVNYISSDFKYMCQKSVC